MWSCAHKTSGVERAGCRLSEGWGEVVLHPKWSCWRYSLAGFTLGFLSVLSWFSPRGNKLPSSQVGSAGASGASFGKGVYKGACFSFSTRQTCAVEGVCEDFAEL